MRQTQTPISAARVPPHKPCPVCHDVMLLSVIQPVGDGSDARTFKCRACPHTETEVGRLSWRPLSARTPPYADNSNTGAACSNALTAASAWAYKPTA
jgi:hypothetical protein